MNKLATLPLSPTEHLDVLIVGAGISGVGAAHHLSTKCPEKSYLILDNKKSFGGTWVQHTYPGIRSDSDMYTFGYQHKPWTGKPVAGAGEILDYLQEAIADDQIDEHIRYQHQVMTASWSSTDQYWLVVAKNKASGEEVRFTANFLWMCQGYYRHDKGYTPEWKGMDNFKGSIVHPQTWPEDLDYTDKKVVVIGSGATAATLIPNMADKCSHITMLQRSPTYFLATENRNELADQLRELDVPDTCVHEIVRRSVLKKSREIIALAKSRPEILKEGLLKEARSHLGDDFDMSHFTPSYRPWQQRLAYVPDGDLFKCLKSGKASVVTDDIEEFTEQGIVTKSGELLQADIIITATGFNMSITGDIAIDVDGSPIDLGETFTYRGLMFSGVPNMSFMFGYLRTPWTMRVDIVSDFVCRLLNHMDSNGSSVCTPTLREQDQDMDVRPFIDSEDISSGWLQRHIHVMPKQGGNAPWSFSGDYFLEKDELPGVSLDENSLAYAFRSAQKMA
jgi:cation diffusion facilitator CzcD-associated flavoprotein CzcO